MELCCKSIDYAHARPGMKLTPMGQMSHMDMFKSYFTFPGIFTSFNELILRMDFLFQSFSYEEQDEAVNNLKSLICTRLKAANTVPEECTSSAITAASSILLVALASLFLSTAAS